MGPLDAIGFGFSSFFSIWQVCILQITPFFLAYVTGLYFAAASLKAKAGLGGRVILPALSFAPGFAVVYALLTMSGLPVGRLSLVLSGRFAAIAFLRRPLVLAVVSLVLGSAFALVYSPCITPALSKILGMAGRSQTAVQGGTLAFFYALGICLALTMTATALVYLLARVGIVRRHPGRARNACGLILAVLAALNLSGTMIYYKAFFLGFLVG
jgi:cytochrome c-type biogenesis protein